MRARGSAFARGYGRPFCGLLTACFVSQWVTGTHGRTASRAFLYGEGAFCVPPHRPFSHAPFVFPRPRFFFFLGPWGHASVDSFSSDIIGKEVRSQAGRLHAVLCSFHVELRNGLPELIVQFRRDSLRYSVESGSENSPELPEEPRDPFFVWIFIGMRGKCCPFLSRIFFVEPSLFI